MAQNVRTTLWLTAAATLVGTGMLLESPKASADATDNDKYSHVTRKEPAITEWMPSPNLRKIVLKTLQQQGKNIQKEGDIKRSYMSSIKEIIVDKDTVVGSGIQDRLPISLKGLELARHLHTLILDGTATNFDDEGNNHYGEHPRVMPKGNVVNLKPIADLKNLKTLKVMNSRLSNIQPLAGMTGLQDLDL